MKPLELAEQLGEAILDSDEYKDFTRAKEAMEASDEAQDLVNTFSDKQQALRDTQLGGKKVSQEQVDQLREHQRTMLENPEIKAYLEAKKEVEGLLAAVNGTISRVTGMEAGGHSHGGGGGGGCSGGCC
ncbi:YlbF family regulator [Dethiobacter alkaliphilus]|uniref:YlbF family regulator n=1 Tax=Dethiobacter alkaliphilus TaxID=427926 RepID=UPI0022280304|nr:YlbF family regulator [Dethiobacter alkaliphilus]MCW3490573.1 YlbF family regulator [Dethiobacter alkaliphilus]